jgi:hypothetical protein
MTEMIDRAAKRDNIRVDPVCAIVNGRSYIGFFPIKEAAEKCAKAWGAIVDTPAVEITLIEPKTKKALAWREVDGFGVWMPCTQDMEPADVI